MAQHQHDPRAGHGRGRGRPSPAIPARRWRSRRRPTCCGPASCGTIPRIPTGPTATGSCSPAATRRCCCTALLHLTGYDLPLEDIRPSGSGARKTPGHPERGHTAGVETTTGPLGQGVGNAVGMAIAERLLAEQFNRPGHAIVDHRTWAFVSDGDLMEGVASEAASLAGHLRLGKLTLIYDDNHITIDGDTALSFSRGRAAAASRPTAGRCVQVGDGNDLAAIDRGAGDGRGAETGRPTLIVLRTYHRRSRARPSATPPRRTARRSAPRRSAGPRRSWAGPTSRRSSFPTMRWRTGASARGAGRRAARRSGARALAALRRRRIPTWPREFERWLSGTLPEGWDAALPESHARRRPLATRQASGLALQALAADGAQSRGRLGRPGRQHRHRRSSRAATFGADEHGPERSTGACASTAWRACLNGIAAHGGLRPFGSTFLVFSDYMKPSIRLAAIMRLPVIYIGTHDSIGLGEDGPTHQPIEHLAMLRAIPNMVAAPPGRRDRDGRGVARGDGADATGPRVLVLTRQKLPVLDRAALGAAAGVRAGRLRAARPRRRRPAGDPDRHRLRGARGARRRPSCSRPTGCGCGWSRMPSWELFAAQPEALSRRGAAAVGPRPASASRRRRRSAGSAGSTDAGAMLGMDGFGASAPGERLFKEFKFTAGARRRRSVRAAAGAEVGMTGQSRWSAWASWARAPGTTTSPATWSPRASSRRLIADDGLRGHDLEPDDLREGDRRQPALRRRHPAAGRRRAGAPAEIFEALAVADVRAACDAFAGLYQATGGARRAGLARGVARRWRTTPRAPSTRPSGCGRAVDRPNAMIKIPGTEAGPAGDHPLPRRRHQRQRHPALLGRALRAR